MNENDPVLIEIDAPLMRITLQRPHCLNALDRRSHFILAEAFDRFSNDSSLNVLFTGTILKDPNTRNIAL